MAKGKKTGGKNFEKGNPGGPGRAPLPPDVKELRQLTRNELEKVLNECLYLTPAQLEKIKLDPESTMIQLLIVSVITHGALKGDPFRVNFLLEQLLGKLKEPIEHSGKVTLEDLVTGKFELPK